MTKEYSYDNMVYVLQMTLLTDWYFSKMPIVLNLVIILYYD